MLIISAHAKQDLIDIWTYIARDNINVADSFLDKIYHLCETISEHPEMGRPRDELSPGVRSLPIKRYVIYYRIVNDDVQIIRILSGYRDLAAIF